ncbi:hypothetical protein DHD32_12825 [Arenibacter sp. TNZ]|nr:hypothetical protein [Arenibacter sp. TNZ]
MTWAVAGRNKKLMRGFIHPARAQLVSENLSTKPVSSKVGTLNIGWLNALSDWTDLAPSNKFLVRLGKFTDHLGMTRKWNSFLRFFL